MTSNIIVLVAQPILTDCGPPAWAADKRAELGWPSSRGKGWPTVCVSGPRLCSFTVPDVVVSVYGGNEAVFSNTSVPAEGVVLVSSGEP